MSLIDLDRALATLEVIRPVRATGRVTELVGLTLRATVPGVRIGELVRIEHGPNAEVVGFRGDEVILMPLGEVRGIGPACEVAPTGESLSIRCGEALLGRVLDGLGAPCDSRGPIPQAGTVPWSVDRPAPNPLTRRRISRALGLGVRAIDALLTIGEGQRMGLLAGAGAGKSMLLGQIARSAEVDVSVICLVGERGREVRDFLDGSLGEAGLRRSVVVCATADAPPLVRLHSALTATAIAEWFREQGARVLFLMDSLTRLARAQREIGLATGEPPARQGYPPSVFALLPRLVERTGNSERGSITALYTVLVAGGDMDEPIADEARAVLDGHIVLARELAARGHWPAIDVLASLSRLMPQVADREHVAAAAALRRMLALYERQRDLIAVGAYRAGSDPATDEAIARIDDIEHFLQQAPDERPPLRQSRARLLELFSPP